LIPSIDFVKRFKIKDISISSIRSDHGREFEKKNLKNSMKKMVFITIFPLQEHQNIMELLKGKVDLFKKWLGPYLTITQPPNIFGMN